MIICIRIIRGVRQIFVFFNHIAAIIKRRTEVVAYYLKFRLVDSIFQKINEALASITVEEIIF